MGVKWGCQCGTDGSVLEWGCVFMPMYELIETPSQNTFSQVRRSAHVSKLANKISIYMPDSDYFNIFT